MGKGSQRGTERQRETGGKEKNDRNTETQEAELEAETAIAKGK